ncbi:ribosomal protein L40E [Nocardiopsis metallicus]|uniref:Ribosomal protein L40E n=1 Tax=Nocardiopsis metallicus TaxID=179819 RepID=A0A840WXY8_9ACTN|nr:ribosomal protein L40E [Nocardiopsis metallicus]
MYCNYCGSWNGGVNQKCRNCQRTLNLRWAVPLGENLP